MGRFDHLSGTATAEGTESATTFLARTDSVFDSRRELWNTLSAAGVRGDLEGHLAILILHTGLRTPEHSSLTASWASILRSLESEQAPALPLYRVQDVATLGVRFALGFDTERLGEYPDLAARELARKPLPPAACIHDDERLLVGVAAGIGRAAPGSAKQLIALLQARRRDVSIRQMCLDLFAESLALGEGRISAATARRAFAQLVAPSAGRPAIVVEDRIAAYWLASRLLDSEWDPTDAELDLLERLIADLRSSVASSVNAGLITSAFDAALIIDAESFSPAARLSRKAALDGVLAVVDSFPTCAAVLARRQRKKPAFEIHDEYDVQDLFYALVLPVVQDMVPEDPASKIAGKASRIDFTSKSTGLGVESKHLKSSGDATRVREEILIDEMTYQEHPYLHTVVVHVHDPQDFIPLSARPAFEADLSTTVTLSGRTVRYIVRVR
jgi:hypothetical protein